MDVRHKEKRGEGGENMKDKSLVNDKMNQCVERKNNATFLSTIFNVTKTTVHGFTT